jgi:hypothetical protein
MTNLLGLLRCSLHTQQATAGAPLWSIPRASCRRLLRY